MQIIDNVAAFQRLTFKSSEHPVGFVPTMGALHAGHLELVRRSKKECAVTVASIFLNPKQFGPKEDLSAYPKPFKHDCELLEGEAVDYLFAPQAADLYGDEFSLTVYENRWSELLCGKFRPGHFAGVTTVVAKLFNIVQPDHAYFGLKDLQQYKIIEKMTRELNFKVTTIACPTVRESDGLALSSRNVYLSAEERAVAPLLYRTLDELKHAYLDGERSTARLIERGTAEIAREARFKLQYLEIRSWNDLSTMEQLPAANPTANPKFFIAIAAHLGQTRLIDNIIV